jgi:FkbM family methyltransferase
VFGTYIGNNKMLVKLGYGGYLTVSSEDLGLMPSLVTTGGFEVPLTNYLIKTLKNGQTFVDIGANLGYFTILAAKLVGNTGKVYGFEPNPHMMKFLKDNIAMNWLMQNVKLYENAIYSSNTEITFHIAKRYQGNSSIYERNENEMMNEEYENVTVQAVRADDHLKDLNNIDWVKIDIEGGEYQALLGMEKLFQKKAIKNIVFEWNPPMLKEDAKLFLEWIEKKQKFQNAKLFGINHESNLQSVTLETLKNLDFYPYIVLSF